MRVCIVAEGCYPYVVGGVSGWIHSMIKAFPNVEFIILAIVEKRSSKAKFAYELPENVTEVHELYLNDCDWGIKRKNRYKLRLKEKEQDALKSLLLDKNTDWGTLFELLGREDLSLDDLLMGKDFLEAAICCYKAKFPQIDFSDYLWSMRSMYLPLFLTMRMEVPKADLYHCVATGYAGVLGSMAKHFYNCGLLISEHGIYTREREEELIKAKWVNGLYKDIWIEQFKKISRVAYAQADLVTSLYEHARGLQIELGCPPAKTLVTPNGINVENYTEIPSKTEEDEGKVNIGAILRVTPIKDVKTLIQAFAFAKKEVPSLKLWIMGPCEENPTYAKECFELVDMLKVEDVVFTGRINVREYIGRMDATILTSISEGQPLTILESYAAHKPVIATDVGNCRGLIFGEDDDFGDAGILTHIMNIEEIARAMVYMAQHEEERLKMGEAGYKRLNTKYKIEDMKKTYEDIYKKFAESMGIEWSEEKFILN